MPSPDTLIEAPHPRRPGASADVGFSPGGFALLFGLLIFAAFPQVLLGLQSFVVRDFGFFAYPLAHYQRECFWKGELPLWNPWNDCGLPFLAQWNTMPLYPPALIYLLLPLSWSLSFFSLVHLFWAGLGMYFLARRWTGSAAGACIAGLIFGFNGFSLNLLMWPSHIATLSWMPWVILTAELAWNEGGRSILTAALVGALQMLAGGPETILFTWLICVALWLAHLAGSFSPGERQTMLPALWRFPLLVFLVAGLCAAQLFPFLDLSAHSQRETGYADARWSMPSWGWANLLAPMVFGSTGKQGLFFQHGQYWTSSYYLGLPALLLAVLAVGSLRSRRVWLLTAAALIGLILATGDQTLLSRWARQILPQLSLMTYPVKFVTFAVFAVPLLAGFGIEWLRTNASDARTSRRALVFAAALLVLLGAVLLWAWRFPLPYDNTSAALRNGVTRAALLLAALALILPFLRSASTAPGGLRSAPRLLFAMLLVLMWLDVWMHEPQQNPAVPAWVYAPGLARQKLELRPPPALGQSRVMLRPAADAKFRGLVLDDAKDNYLVKRLGFFADCNLLDSVPKVDGFFSLYPREIGELNSAIYVSAVPFGPGLLDFLSVSHITAPDDHTQWIARHTQLPLLTSGQQPVFMDDTNAIRTLLSAGFDSRKTVLLPLPATQIVTATNGAVARVSGADFQPHRIRFDVEAPAPALLVLAQTFYHSWRAYINGAPTKILRANYAFQAVQVPAGAHQLELRYEDRAFQAGALVSTLTLFGCAATWVIAAVRARKVGRHA